MTYWIIENVLGTCSLTELTPKGAIIVDVRDLTDGWNDPLVVREKAEIVFKAINTGTPTIIRCQAGIGRSNAIAVAVLCLMNGKSWNQNENLVRKKVTRTFINASLRSCCSQAVNK